MRNNPLIKKGDLTKKFKELQKKGFRYNFTTFWRYCVLESLTDKELLKLNLKHGGDRLSCRFKNLNT